jgi:hypothetical protein
MSGEQSSQGGARLEVAYFELVAARPAMALLRLGGSWSGVEPGELEPPTLVLEADGQEHRLPALPEAQAPGEDAPPWRAAFAAPGAAVAASSATYRLDAGPVVPLPAPVERRLGGEPQAPAEPGPRGPRAASEQTRAAPARRAGPRLVAVAVLVLVALLIVIAVATSGGDDASGDRADDAVTLMDVLPMGGTASGEILRDGDGRLVLRLRGLQGKESGVWLFDSVIDARLLGTVEGPSGSVVLPPAAELGRFRYVDVSREGDENANHSGLSVLRVDTSAVVLG